MCLILFAYKQHPKYKLILAANRDEFRARPTAKAAYWSDSPLVLAGRDLERGGTWLGISNTGQLSAITNFREAHANLLDDAPSRGDLTADFIKGKEHPASYLEALHADERVFNGYNLLLGNPDELYHYSNKEGKINRLEAGIYGLSNHLLDTPWPKVTLGKQLLKQHIEQPELQVDDLLAVLENIVQPRDEDLPKTGIGTNWERMLGPMFIDTEAYGTYCSTIILWDNNNQVDFYEKIHRDQLTQHFRLQVGAD